MALEQFEAWLRGGSQADLGPVVTVGPDQFQMLVRSELAHEHELITEYLLQFQAQGRRFNDNSDVACDALNTMFALRPAPTSALILAMVERVFWDAEISPQTFDRSRLDVPNGVFDSIMARLIGRAEVGRIRKPLLKWIASHIHLHRVAITLQALLQHVTQPLGATETASLETIHAALADDSRIPGGHLLAKRAAEILGAAAWHSVLVQTEPWARKAASDLDAAPKEKQAAWRMLLEHCVTARSANPSAKWTRIAAALLGEVGHDEFRARLLEWLPAVDEAAEGQVRNVGGRAVGNLRSINDRNADVLRGLLWICPQADSAELRRAITAVAVSAYRKIPGVGPRAVKVGNAALTAFGNIGTVEAVGQLAILKVRVKFRTAQKLIEKALNATSAKAGISREDLEEMAVPSYGLSEVGAHAEQLGDHTGRVVVEGKRAELQWFKADGKRLVAVPKQVSESFPEDLKELKSAVKDITQMLPAQSARIEALWLAQKSWPLQVWRERYLDHPLVGALARRLIWKVGGTSVIAPAGRLESRTGEEVRPADGAVVSLWHPLEESEAEVQAWRSWLMQNSIQQPFKQAHREVYVLTDAERQTATYSNRFAGHVLKQHQFNSLAAARGWRHPLRLMVDAEYPPAHVEVPSFGIRAEFWVEGAGGEYGTDTNEAGAYLRLTTDQVRFYRLATPLNSAHAGGGGYSMRAADEAANHPMALADIPPLLLSELLRDVDLFVGVASVGNDPNWSDGGPQGRYREYWGRFAFGELSATAQTRKSILERLLPKLKIASVARIEQNWLVVAGSLRTYKIHLGSGNILMLPNDQYLCIVQSQSARTKSEEVFLPFDGDSMLSVILSKAFLLANDKAIKDPTILSQIGRQV